LDDNPQSNNVLNSHQQENFDLNDDFSDLDDDVRSHQSEEFDDDWMEDTFLDEEPPLFSQ
jgi:hypothetical protein